MDVSRAFRSPFQPQPPVATPARTSRPAEDQRPERPASPERRPAEAAEDETHAAERRRARGLVEDFHAVRRGPVRFGGSASAATEPGGSTPPANAPGADGTSALIEGFQAAREQLSVRLDNALQSATSRDDAAQLQGSATRAEQRLFDRLVNALGGLFLDGPSQPASSDAVEPAPTAQVVTLADRPDLVDATLASPAPPTDAAGATNAAEAPAVAPGDAEANLVDRLVQANAAIDRRLSNALEGVTNPDDVAALEERATAARDRVATRFLNALGRERGLEAAPSSSTVDRELVERFLDARSSFQDRARNALASATEPDARAAIEQALTAAQTRLGDRFLNALGASQAAPSGPNVAAAEPVEPRSLVLDGGALRGDDGGVDGTTSDDAAAPSDSDARRVLTERFRAALETLRQRASRAFDGVGSRREHAAVAQRVDHAREALLERVHHHAHPADEA